MHGYDWGCYTVVGDTDTASYRAGHHIIVVGLSSWVQREMSYWYSTATCRQIGMNNALSFN